MIGCIADASALLKLAIDEVDSKIAVAYLERNEPAAPAIAIAEVANVLRRLVKSRRNTLDDARLSFDRIRWTIEILPETEREAHLTLDLAIELDHPAQDCRYLAAAITAKVPLVTADEGFVRKARAAGYDARGISELTRYGG